MPRVPEIDGYEIVRELGRGAMGVVYLARDRLLEREVAIKVLAEGGADTAAIERFVREGRATARLSHPNVVTIYRAGIANGELYLVMELLRGRALDAVLAESGPFALDRLLAVALDATRGLAAAHARGIVHRDIKPSNLFQTEEGGIKVLDFGIAKLAAGAAGAAGGVGGVAAEGAAGGKPGADTDAGAGTGRRSVGGGVEGGQGVDPALEATSTSDPALDRTGISDPNAGENAGALLPTRTSASGESEEKTAVGGTPLFMAPEVWRQEGADHASDVFSLGATLYALATGAPPFVGRNMGELAFIVLSATPAAALSEHRPDLPRALCELVDRALSKSRAKRPASAMEFLTEIERVAREARGPRTIVGSPYPGLRSMNQGDRDRFFGREEDVARVVERLRAEALVVLVGPSGAGKSSLAAAGVAPAVAEGALGSPAKWKVVRVAPGRAPASAIATAIAPLGGQDPDALARALRDEPDALARALREHVARSGEGVLLLVDQLEEMITLSAGAERDAAAAALGRLVDLCPPGVRVLATARSDLFDRLGALDVLGVSLGRATELVRPLAGRALREAIVEPARAAGLGFEDETVVDGILAEVGRGEGALPLVAFAMRAWWEKRDKARNVLTTAAFREVGGVAGALGAHAEMVYDALAPDDRPVARAVFLRLVAEDGTRRYATRADLAESAGSEPAVERVVEAFSRARLLLVEGDGATAQVTVMHEALARAWPRLSEWQTEGREDRVIEERLRAAAEVWNASGRKEELLLRDALLLEVTRWREVFDDRLGAVEREFADQSVRSQRARQRRQWLGAGVMLVALGGLLVRQYVISARERSRADEMTRRWGATQSSMRDALAVTATSAAASGLARDPAGALAWLAQSQVATGGTEVSLAARVWALAAQAQGVGVQLDCDVPPALSDDGQRAACVEDGEVTLLDLSREAIARVHPSAAPASIALAARADAVAWVDSGGDAWLARAGTAPARVGQGFRGRTAVALDPDGNSVVVYERDERRLVLAGEGARGGREIATVPAPDGATLLSVRATGRAAAVFFARRDGVTEILRADVTASDAGVLPSFHARSYAVDGATLAWVDENSALRVTDLDSGAMLPCAPSVTASSVALAPQFGRIAWVARASGDGGASTEVGWGSLPACTDVERAPAPGIEAVWYAPSGEILGLSHDAPARLLDPAGHEFGQPRGPADPAGVPLRVLGGERGVAMVAGADGRAVFRGPSPWQGPLGLPDADALRAGALLSRGRAMVSDDAGRLFVYGPPPSAGTTFARWREGGGEVRPGAGGVRVVALPNERAAVLAPGAGLVLADFARRSVTPDPNGASVTAVASAGERAMLVRRDGSAEVLDLRDPTRRVRGRLTPGAQSLVAAIEPEGTRAAAAAADAPVVLRTIPRTASTDWPAVGFHAYSELSGPVALALSGDRMAVASYRLGFVDAAGNAAFADEAPGFRARAVTSARFGDDGALWLTTDDCAVWSAECEGDACDVRRVAAPGEACAIDTRDDALIGVSPRRGLVAIDPARGISAVIIPPDVFDDRGIPLGRAVAVSLGDDAIVLAGPPAEPFIARVALPPGDLARWVAQRTNVVIGPGGGAEPRAQGR